MRASRIRMLQQRVPKVAPALLLAVCLLHAPAQAHEAQWPTARIVLRDDGHCALSLEFDLARALRVALQPQVPMAEFLAVASAQTPASFAREWARLTARWSREVMLESGSSRREAQRWRWPSADDAQALLRRQLMQGLTGGDAPDHAPALMIAQAEFTLPRPKSSTPIERPDVRLVLPAAFRPLSLTSYQPHQQWVRPGEDPIALRF